MKKPELPSLQRQALDKAGNPPRLPLGYRNALLTIIERRLKSDKSWEAYTTPEQLARALRANSNVPLPPEIHNYLCDILEGKIKKPNGRPPDSQNLWASIKKDIAPVVYDRYFIWLNKRIKSVGLNGWSAIKNAHWWQGPPSQRAARMTCRALSLSIDWKSLLNTISKSKRNG